MGASTEITGDGQNEKIRKVGGFVLTMVLMEEHYLVYFPYTI